LTDGETEGGTRNDKGRIAELLSRLLIDETSLGFVNEPAQPVEK